MKTFRLLVKPKSKSTSALTAIKVEFTEQTPQGKQRKKVVTTNLKVQAGQWNQKTQLVRKRKDAGELNKRLAEIRSDIQAALDQFQLDDQTVTLEMAAEATRNIINGTDSNSVSFTKAATLHLAQLAGNQQVSRRKTIMAAVNHFTEFCRPGSNDATVIGFDELNRRNLQAFIEHLQTSKGQKASTIRKVLGAIASIYRAAIRQDMIEQGTNPFALLVYPKMNKPVKTKLSYSQFANLVNVEQEKENEGVALNLFCFAVYVAGIRFGDALSVTWQQVRDGRLHLVTQKTGTPMSILIRDEAQAILERYEHRRHNSHFIFPLLEQRDYFPSKGMAEFIRVKESLNSSVNRHLKKMAMRAGIAEKVTFHVARHTFADLCRTQGLSMLEIKSMLGHSKIAQTEAYLKDLGFDEVDAAMQSLDLPAMN